MPLPNPIEAHVASDGARMVVAAKGVAEICVWSAALHTVTLGVRSALLPSRTAPDVLTTFFLNFLFLKICRRRAAGSCD